MASYFAACRSRWLGFFEAEARGPERTLPKATTTVVYLSKRDVSPALSDVSRARGERMTTFYVERNDERPLPSHATDATKAFISRLSTASFVTVSEQQRFGQPPWPAGHYARIGDLR